VIKKPRAVPQQHDGDAKGTAIEAVADLAEVKARDVFIERLDGLLTWVYLWHRPRNDGLFWFGLQQQEREEILPLVEKAAAALRVANKAVQALRPEMINVLMDVVPPNRRFSSELRRYPSYLWPQILEQITYGFCALAGLQPEKVGPEGKRGRPKGTFNDWLLSRFVWELAAIAMATGGDLGASKKDNRGFGAMFEALELLRELLPKGFQRANTVQAVVSSVKAAKEYQAVVGFR
jgi:hypothetical protein